MVRSQWWTFSATLSTAAHLAATSTHQRCDMEMLLLAVAGWLLLLVVGGLIADWTEER